MSTPVYRTPAGAATVEGLYRDVLDQWPVPKTEHFLETCQGKTFVLACGPEDAPPVVLLHGSQANVAAWRFDVPLWATRFRLYAIDMIGEAGFSAPVRPDLASEAHALWLDDVFQGLGLSQATLVGTSLGGWLALDYAHRRPDAVRGLALICPAGIGRQKNFLLKAFPLLFLGSWGKRKMREQVFGPTPEPLPEEVRPLMTLMEAVASAIRPRVVQLPQLTDSQLAGLKIPLLAIVGGKDVLLDSQDTWARLQRCTPQAEVCFFDDGYHFLPNQAPRIFDFLERTHAGHTQER